MTAASPRIDKKHAVTDIANFYIILIMGVYEIYVEKKNEFASEAASVAADFRLALKIESVEKVRVINRYFAENISAADFASCKNTVFSEPPVDIVYDTLPPLEGARVFAVEFLPGQFDQRADSCAQCVCLATGKERPIINSSKIYAVYGNISDERFSAIKSWLINPVESREASMEKPDTLNQKHREPEDVAVINGFTSLSGVSLEDLRRDKSLAMDLNDIKFCQTYFRDAEKRDPTVTELRALDTYWSDHCRHTTFLTEITETLIEDEEIRESYENYLSTRESLGRAGSPVTLMDMATIGAKSLLKKGLLPDLDASEEINACSVKIKVDVDGKEQDWLLMFKNETHNHPTEIEPFGGAATCLGGAIRDPLAGRAFVYQAMRVTGAGDPLEDASRAPAGKLPQRKICRSAAAGYSSYGNQIGLATGLVDEIYHPGYAAKRMEIGAVIGAVPASNVVRKSPIAGDVVILLGGRTGRDGIGGATGSSNSHTTASLATLGAEVQKGNAPEERKLQRLFRDPNATRLIKRCNDFGAGGICVSVGELADGLVINLDKIPKKYDGLDGTELAISESQERMSVVTAKKDAARFIALARIENLEATIIGKITKEKRLVMKWRGKTIVNLSRDFLNSNGARKISKALIKSPAIEAREKIVADALQLENLVSGLNICSRKGLSGMFDASIGAATVIAPFGGRYQLTPAQTMAARIPVLKGDTKTCSLMSWGFDPEISSASPYHGAIFAIIHSLSKIIASGGSRKRCWLSFQEYFAKSRDDPQRWGKPAAALLGALDAQLGLEIAAIGGKDSMSGSFAADDGKIIDVPPTLVSFAVSTAKIGAILTPEFKKPDNPVYFIKPPFTISRKPNFAAAREYFDNVEKLIAGGKIISAWAVGAGGAAEAVVKMCFGNQVGFISKAPLSEEPCFGGFVVETRAPLESGELLGRVTRERALKTPLFETSLAKTLNAWERPLEPVYPYLIAGAEKSENFKYDIRTRGEGRSLIGDGASIKKRLKAGSALSKPVFFIPVFPGTNSEYDTERAIEKAGGRASVFVIQNRAPSEIARSVRVFAKLLRSAKAMVIPGGFSGGDEPDGSGKFITAFIRNPRVHDAVMDLLENRDGLICGICNGFQALIKLGLVPFGEIRDMTESSPTLAGNAIGRHQSTLARTRIVSNKSPWLSHLELGDEYTIPVSHGEGRFVADEELIRSLAANGQIATQYVDLEGNATMDIRFNPNNSAFAIEGVTSQDGRVFGRMAHNERFDDGLYRNIQDIRKMDIFAGAVKYFSF